MDNWKKYLLPTTSTLKDAIFILEQNQCAIIVDQKGRLAGTITDRDVRKALIKHKLMSSSVTESMNKNPTFLSYPLNYSQARKIHQKNSFEQYPIVDNKKVVCGISTNNELVTKRLTNPVILMAGGIGSRLAPLTNNCPKPLLQIGDRPILEIILDELSHVGFNDF